MKTALVGMGLLVVLAAPLGLLVLGVGVVRSGVRGGTRFAVAVAGVSFAVAALAYGTGLAHADIASHLDAAQDCTLLCAGRAADAVDGTPVRPLGQALLAAAVVDGLLLAWWWYRSDGAVGRLGPQGLLVLVATVTVVLGVVMGLRALAVPHADGLGRLADTTHDETELAIWTLVTCAVAALGTGLALRATGRATSQSRYRRF